MAPQGQTPQNLPIGEPEDVFAQTDVNTGAGVASPGVPQEPVAVGGIPSALDAGILKPKVNVPPPASLPPRPDPQMMSQMDSLQTLKEPTMSRGIMTAVVVLISLLFIGGAVWWVVRYINVPKISSSDVPVDGDTLEQNLPSEDSVNSPISDDSFFPEVGNTSSQPVDDNLLFGEESDTDSDGLDDRREETLGTDPTKIDSDQDELSDGDEVIIWSTDPLNPDTDNDTYLDGKEIKAGFSPKGPGKLFEVNSSTRIDATASSSTSTINE